MKLEKVKTRLGLKPSTTKAEVLQALRQFGVDDSMYTLLQEYEIRPHETWTIPTHVIHGELLVS